MKFVFFLSFFLLVSVVGFAQEDVLPVDEFGKYTFMQIGTVKPSAVSLMSSNVKGFFKKNRKMLQLKTEEGDTIFRGIGKMIVRKGVSGIGHPSGEAKFDITLALRSGKYKLILTNFLLTDYERDRYGNFVPAAIHTELEQKPDKLSRPKWEAYMAFITNESKKIADALKSKMDNSIKDQERKSKESKTISTNAW